MLPCSSALQMTVSGVPWWCSTCWRPATYSKYSRFHPFIRLFDLHERGRADSSAPKCPGNRRSAGSGKSAGEHHERKPSEVMDEYFLYSYTNSQTHTANAEGKWMLFYHMSRIDEAWEKAKGKQKAGLLPGVDVMKVTTAAPNPLASNPSDKVIIFYCGSEADKEGTLAVGRTILREMEYTGSGAPYPSKYPPRIYWKSDRATDANLYSSSERRVSTFSLPYQRAVNTVNKRAKQ